MDAPFYYVCLYVQLVVISPIIFQILNLGKGKSGVLFEVVILVTILGVSLVTTNYSNIMGIIGWWHLLHGFR